MRSRDIRVKGSHRYKSVDDYLIPGKNFDKLTPGLPLPELLEAELRHAAESGEPYAEFDRLYTLKNKLSDYPAR